MGRDGLVSRVTKTSVGQEVLGSNPTGAVSNIGQVRFPRCLSLGMLLVYPKRMAVGVKPPKEEGGILT